MAVTSGSHPKRRSRSLGEMREAASVHTVARRRSDEIRYWRESYDPGILSPLSSHKAEAEEPIVIDEPEDNRDDEPQEQPQPFNFGPLGEMAGMKITQAASLDTRVRRLEERMLKMERVLYSRQNRSSAYHVRQQITRRYHCRSTQGTESPRHLSRLKKAGCKAVRNVRLLTGVAAHRQYPHALRYILLSKTFHNLQYLPPTHHLAYHKIQLAPSLLRRPSAGFHQVHRPYQRMVISLLSIILP